MMDNVLTSAVPLLPPGHRVYAIGDVHGHCGRLRQMHGLIRADLAARPAAAPLLVHVGDLIDRGPDSAGVVALLAEGPPIGGVPTVNLMGNHEWMMLRALATKDADDIDRWLDNGGAATLASWGLKSTSPPRAWLEAIPARHLVLLRDLQLCHVEGGYVFVHAGVRPGVPLAQQRETDMLWIRESFLRHEGPCMPEAPGRVVVHGHTPIPAVEILANRIGIDTGAGKGGPLSCVALEGDSVRILQVEAA